MTTGDDNVVRGMQIQRIRAKPCVRWNRALTKYYPGELTGYFIIRCVARVERGFQAGQEVTVDV